MKRLLLILLIGCFTAGCPGIGPTPPPPTTTTTSIDNSMYCETYYEGGPCRDGSYLRICVAMDGSRCGVESMGLFYACSNCYNIEGGSCDGAIISALNACYGFRVGALQTDGIDVDEIATMRDDILMMFDTIKN